MYENKKRRYERRQRDKWDVSYGTTHQFEMNQLPRGREDGVSLKELWRPVRSSFLTNTSRPGRFQEGVRSLRLQNDPG
jgi:hypothetical protein